MDFTNVEELTWSQARDIAYKVDPIVTQIIDEWNPGKDYTLIKISYPYGAQILNNGTFQIASHDGNIVPLSHHNVPDSLRKKLNYSSLPLGFLVKGSVEIYRDFYNRIFSLGFFGNGFDLGIWEAFASPAPYSLSAGARTIFMIPRISDKDAHRKLKSTYDLRTPPPKHLFDQWHVFVELAKRLKSPWQCETLFLTNKWLEEQPNKLGWIKFKEYLRAKAWKHTEYARNRTVFEVSWKEFFEILIDKGLRPDPYLIETLRNLIFIAQGTLPALASANGSDIPAPCQELQKIYTANYGLKHYVPTLMVPHHFNINEKLPVYYSLQVPTLLDFIPKAKILTSAIDDLRELKDLMNYFSEEIFQNNLKFEDQSLYELLTNVQYDFFHSEMHTYSGIQSSEKLAGEDATLLYMPDERKDRQFAYKYKSSLMRCCIRISPRVASPEK